MTADKPDRDLDKEFEELIAHWDADLPAAEPPSPASPPAASSPPASPPPASRPPASPTPPPGVNIWRGPTIWRPPEDVDRGPDGSLSEDSDRFGDSRDPDDVEDFEPAPVHLPPQEDLHFWGIVLGLVGGGLLLLYVAATGVSRSSWWFLAAIALFVGGFALLILRQPRDRDISDDGTRL